MIVKGQIQVRQFASTLKNSNIVVPERPLALCSSVFHLISLLEKTQGIYLDRRIQELKVLQGCATALQNTDLEWQVGKWTALRCFLQPWPLICLLISAYCWYVAGQGCSCSRSQLIQLSLQRNHEIYMCPRLLVI